MLRVKKLISSILLVTIIMSTSFLDTYAAKDETQSESQQETKGNNKSDKDKEKDNKNKNADKHNREKTELIIKFKDNQTETKQEKVKNNVKNKLKLKKLESKKKTGKFEILTIDSEENIDLIVEEFNNSPDVEYAQPNYKLNSFALPQDELFVNQWALNNSQEIEGQVGIPGADINIITAWDTSKGSSDIVVGILDTGIDIMHSDLVANIYINEGEIPDDGLDNDNNGYIDDIQGWDFYNGDNSVNDTTDEVHGTHIAGIIASDENTSGTIGVAPECRILPLKFINGSYGFTSDAIEGIEYTENMGVKILNCSWGGDQYNHALKEAIENSDMLFVCAAGNNGLQTSAYPAAFDLPNVISVGALDKNAMIAQFSNFGDTVDIFAPGVNIISTLPNSEYGYLSGTSMAVPFVTGLSALIKSQDINVTPEQVKSTITNNARLSDNPYPYLIINATAALSHIV